MIQILIFFCDMVFFPDKKKLTNVFYNFSIIDGPECLVISRVCAISQNDCTNHCSKILKGMFQR